MFSFLREADKSDGSPGPLSSRRIAAFIMIFFAVPLFILAFKYSGSGWFVFIPGGLCLVLAVVLFLFTTMADLKEIVEAATAFKK
jgi:lipopolysaccharide export LptBFGC system permease protein LptF